MTGRLREAMGKVMEEKGLRTGEKWGSYEDRSKGSGKAQGGWGGSEDRSRESGRVKG